MVPRILIDETQVPGGGALKLFQRGNDFSITLVGNELMNSRMSASEEALAVLAAARLARPNGRWLIGGLGMGFTLRAALGVLGADAQVTVVELVPAVIAWARGPMAAFHGNSLDDPRVAVVEGDVIAAIAASPAGYDAILLDVDNGPDGLTRKGNDALYSARGLAATRAALAPGGLVAIWSAGSDDVFARRLGNAGFDVEEVVVRARGSGKGARHVIWLGRRPG